MLMNFYEETDRALNAIQTACNGVFDAATGTGKGVIISRDMSRVLNTTPSVTVFAGHRILLAAQGMERTVQDSYDAFGHVPFRRIGVSSGEGESIETETLEEQIALSKYPAKMCREIDSLKEELQDSIDQGSNVGLYTTYHSVWKVYVACLQLGIRPDFYADEIHVPAGDKDKWEAVKQMVSQSNRYYAFSATLDKYRNKVEQVFGKTIFHLPAHEAIDKGLICKPQWMLVHVEGKRETSLAQGVYNAFIEHDKRNAFDPKALVHCNDTSDIKSIQKSKQIKELKSQYPDIMIAVISSNTGCIIDGKLVKRPEWIRSVNNHNGPLLVMHIDICNAGIDVPEFNLPLWTYLPGSETKIVQGNGRGCRLHPKDRSRLEKGKITTADRSTWYKPYNTVGLLVFEDSLEEDEDTFVDFILKSREQGFQVNDAISLRKNSGKKGSPFFPPEDPKARPQDLKSLCQVRVENEELLEATIKAGKLTSADDIFALFD